jgi:hypothetical protein
MQPAAATDEPQTISPSRSLAERPSQPPNAVVTLLGNLEDAAAIPRPQWVLPYPQRESHLICLQFLITRTSFLKMGSFLIHAAPLVIIFWIPTPRLPSHLVNHNIRDDETLKQHPLNFLKTLIAFAILCKFSVNKNIQTAMTAIRICILCHSPLHLTS